MEYIRKHRKWTMVLFIAIGFLFISGVIFDGLGWWWLLIPLFPFIGLNIYLYNDVLESKVTLTNQIRLGLKWIALAELVFVLIASFITPWWLFGLTIPVALLAIRNKLLGMHPRIELSKKDRDTVLVISAYLFIVFLLFFAVPSFIANNHANPKDHFPLDYVAVDSYKLYGITPPYNREHVIARSWYADTNNFVNDYVNVIWSNQTANGERGNNRFCNIPKRSEFEVYSDLELVGYIRDDCFMPTDEFKGDVARIVLYMYVTYQDDGLDRSHIDLSLMKSWAKIDPVSTVEMQRNKAIQNRYGYSNRFVNNPGLIRYIV